jgi:hypothetical protein
VRGDGRWCAVMDGDGGMRIGEVDDAVAAEAIEMSRT